VHRFPKLTAPAKADLEEIWTFIAQDNIDAARRYNKKILQKCEQLAEFPRMGRERTELSPGLRGFPIDNYIMYYRETDFGIEVIRILSGFRDIPALFKIE
jgi:toxin ParE1/3/4